MIIRRNATVTIGLHAGWKPLSEIGLEPWQTLERSSTLFTVGLLAGYNASFAIEL